MEVPVREFFENAIRLLEEEGWDTIGVESLRTEPTDADKEIGRLKGRVSDMIRAAWEKNRQICPCSCTQTERTITISGSGTFNTQCCVCGASFSVSVSRLRPEDVLNTKV